MKFSNFFRLNGENHFGEIPFLELGMKRSRLFLEHCVSGKRPDIKSKIKNVQDLSWVRR